MVHPFRYLVQSDTWVVSVVICHLHVHRVMVPYTICLTLYSTVQRKLHFYFTDLNVESFSLKWVSWRFVPTRTLHSNVKGQRLWLLADTVVPFPHS